MFLIPSLLFPQPSTVKTSPTPRVEGLPNAREALAHIPQPQPPTAIRDLKVPRPHDARSTNSVYLLHGVLLSDHPHSQMTLYFLPYIAPEPPYPRSLRV